MAEDRRSWDCCCGNPVCTSCTEKHKQIFSSLREEVRATEGDNIHLIKEIASLKKELEWRKTHEDEISKLQSNVSDLVAVEAALYDRIAKEEFKTKQLCQIKEEENQQLRKQFEENLTDLHNEKSQLQSKVDRLESEKQIITSLQEEVRARKGGNIQLTEEIASLKKELEWRKTHEDEISKLQSNVYDLVVDKTALKDGIAKQKLKTKQLCQIKEKENKQLKKEFEENLTTLQNEISQLQTKVDRLESEKQELGSMLLQRLTKEFDQRIQLLKEEKSKLETMLTKQDETVIVHRRKIQVLQNEVDTKNRKVEVAMKDIEKNAKEFGSKDDSVKQEAIETLRKNKNNFEFTVTESRTQVLKFKQKLNEIGHQLYDEIDRHTRMKTALEIKVKKAQEENIELIDKIEGHFQRPHEDTGNADSDSSEVCLENVTLDFESARNDRPEVVKMSPDLRRETNEQDHSQTTEEDTSDAGSNFCEVFLGINTSNLVSARSSLLEIEQWLQNLDEEINKEKNTYLEFLTEMSENYKKMTGNLCYYQRPSGNMQKEVEEIRAWTYQICGVLAKEDIALKELIVNISRIHPLLNIESPEKDSQDDVKHTQQILSGYDDIFNFLGKLDMLHEKGFVIVSCQFVGDCLSKLNVLLRQDRMESPNESSNMAACDCQSILYHLITTCLKNESEDKIIELYKTYLHGQKSSHIDNLMSQILVDVCIPKKHRQLTIYMLKHQKNWQMLDDKCWHTDSDDFNALMIAKTPQDRLNKLFGCQEEGASDREGKRVTLLQLISGNADKTILAVLDSPLEQEHKCQMLEMDTTCRLPTDENYRFNDFTAFQEIAFREKQDIICHRTMQYLINEKWTHWCRNSFGFDAFVYFVSLAALTSVVAISVSAPDVKRYNSPLGNARIALELIIYAVSIRALVTEVYQLYSMRRRQNAAIKGEVKHSGGGSFLRSYLRDKYNVLEFAAALLIVLVLPLRFLHEQAHWFLFALGYLLWLLRIFKYAAIFRLTGEYAEVLIQMMKGDLIQFGILIVVTVVTFAGTFVLVLKGESSLHTFEETSTFMESILLGVRIMIESDSIIDYMGSDETDGLKFTGIIVLMLFMFIIMVIMLNILIAQLSGTYQKIKDASVKGYLVRKAQIVARLERDQLLVNFTQNKYKVRLYQHLGENNFEPTSPVPDLLQQNTEEMNEIKDIQQTLSVDTLRRIRMHVTDNQNYERQSMVLDTQTDKIEELIAEVGLLNEKLKLLTNVEPARKKPKKPKKACVICIILGHHCPI